ncbi:MAG: hypothetical protein Q8L10_04395 [Candidatus Moranbacteria bacterium]|nr:hypothetical protein [Candidatus Moranbacteria bacterium]
MKKMLFYLLCIILALCLAVPVAAKNIVEKKGKARGKTEVAVTTVPTTKGGKATTSGDKGGGKPSASTDYGDLYVILRDLDGVPILSAAGCLQPLDADGNLLLLDEECGVLEAADNVPVEVDFGRLSVARSPDSVLEASFDEVISLIKLCRHIDVDASGRLQLETLTEAGEVTQKTIDSPLENLALYSYLMRNGHIQTAETVADEHGGEVTLHPALDADTDYGKFGARVRFLLPVVPNSIEAEPLTNDDLTFAGFFLAAAADKTGTITVDLVQYLNRILEIPNLTNCLPDNPDFVNFRGLGYWRNTHFDQSVDVILPTNYPGFWYATEINLLDWLAYKNGEPVASNNIAAFVHDTNDALRVIEFIHNYEVPATLWPVQVTVP